MFPEDAPAVVDVTFKTRGSAERVTARR